MRTMNRFIRFFAACCGMVACSFVIVSVWIYAVPFVGPAGAPLIAAIPLVFACAAGCLIASVLAGIARPKQ